MGQRLARAFLGRFFEIVRIVSPVIGFLLLTITLFGIAEAYVEGWAVSDGIYFAFVTALTIGYGDLTAKRNLGRFIAILIGFNGIVLTGVIVAGAVQSLRFVLIETYGDFDNVKVQDSSYGILHQARESRKSKKEK